MMKRQNLLHYIKINNIEKYENIKNMKKIQLLILIVKNYKKQILMNKIKAFLMNYLYKNQENNIVNNEILELKKQIFQLQTKTKDYEYKIQNYKSIIRNIQIEKHYSSSTSSCSNNSDNEKNRIPYSKIPQLSKNQQLKIIYDKTNYKYDDVKKLSTHELKKCININNNNEKYNRLFNT